MRTGIADVSATLTASEAGLAGGRRWAFRAIMGRWFLVAPLTIFFFVFPYFR